MISRNQAIKALPEERLDVLVIGGGVTGAGVALDAAARGACRPINDKRGTAEFRTKIAGVLARRAAAIAYGRARAKGEK